MRPVYGCPENFRSATEHSVTVGQKDMTVIPMANRAIDIACSRTIGQKALICIRWQTGC